VNGANSWLQWLEENGRHWDKAALEAEREHRESLEAQAAAMREALEAAAPHHQGRTSEPGRLIRVALAPDAGKALLEWKQSAMTALGEWHQARELIGGAQLGDGPKEWAQRVLERLRKAEEHVALWKAAAESEFQQAKATGRELEKLRKEFERAFAACASHEEVCRGLIAKRDDARAVLREVEWIGEETGVTAPFCPRCGRMRSGGHAPDCRLKKALGEGG
jgi:hypothetical protein